MSSLNFEGRGDVSFFFESFPKFVSPNFAQCSDLLNHTFYFLSIEGCYEKNNLFNAVNAC